MSFLDNLLTLDEPLDQGKDIIVFPRTWRRLIPWSKERPFSYRAHKTRAGLYVVIPHHKDGSLFLEKDEKKKKENKKWPLGKYSVDGFNLAETSLKEEDKTIILSSSIRKELDYEMFKHLDFSTNFSVEYTVNEQAVPLDCKISYSIVLSQKHFKEVKYRVLRNSTGGINSYGPRVETNMTPFEKEPDHYVDNEATLENLVGIVLRQNTEELYSLFNLSYVEQRLLH